MTAKEMLGKVDHTQLKAFATWEDIQKLCDEAIQYHTASVCVPPCYIKRIHDTYGDKINICTVVGFPLGYSVTEAKVAEVRKGSIPCGTLVIDTADWAERLCIQAVCARAKVNGIEDFGYGKGYTYVKEEFSKLLDALEEVLNAGHNVVVLAHAAITKFEQPDAVGNYDRWGMKTSKQVAPLLREWCDMLLFANYKTVVEKAGSSPNAKNKASGGRRVMYTTHHPCWDAKNRFGLPDEMPFDYAGIAACISGTTPAPAPQPEPPAETVPKALLVPDLIALGVPEKLAPLMSANNVTPEELQAVVGKRGYFPEDMPIKDYPMDFVEGCLIAAWPQVLQMVLDSRDLPF